MLSISPHTSHYLQLLDQTFFDPLKIFYNQEADKWMESNPGKRITDLDVIFAGAFQRAATLKTPRVDFALHRHSTFNPDVFNEHDFVPSSVTEIV